MKLLAQYCEAVATYRKNVSGFFDVKIFTDRGARILDLMKPFHPQIGSGSPISIEFCDMLLQGVEERQAPEALRRNTRV
jgi:hypothetical protein